MKLGISTYTYTWSVGIPGSEPEKPWDELKLVNKAKELGVDCLQVADNLPLHLMAKERLAQLKKRARETGIELEVGGRGMSSDLLAVYIRIADALDASLLRFVIDGPGYTPVVDEVIGTITAALPDLENRGIKLAIENHDRLKARDFLKIIRGVNSKWVGICLDSVNSLGAGEGIETITSLLAPHVFNLHIKEFIVERHPHKMGFTIEGRPVGQGQLPLAWILEQLGSSCQSAILESWTPPGKNIHVSMQREEQWARESIHYLKSNFFN